MNNNTDADPNYEPAAGINVSVDDSMDEDKNDTINSKQSKANQEWDT